MFKASAGTTAAQSCQCFAGFRASRGTEAWTLCPKWGGREEEERGKPLKDFCSGVAKRFLFWMMNSFYENDLKVRKREIVNVIWQRSHWGLTVYTKVFPYLWWKACILPSPKDGVILLKWTWEIFRRQLKEWSPKTFLLWENQILKPSLWLLVIAARSDCVQEHCNLICVFLLGKKILKFLFHWMENEVGDILRAIDLEDFERNFRKQEVFLVTRLKH